MVRVFVFLEATITISTKPDPGSGSCVLLFVDTSLSAIPVP